MIKDKSKRVTLMKPMKRIIYITFFSALILTSCSTETSIPASVEVTEATTITEETTVTSNLVDNMPEPELIQIRNICKLATIKCCYNNVAKSVKSAGTGIWHLGEKERTFWIEYSGEAEIGIDMSEVKMNVVDNEVTITMPEAQILSITVNPESYTDDSYVISPDRKLNKNPILPEEQAEAIKSAQDDMKNSVLNNKSLLISAQDRAKQLIENYINQIGKISNTSYEIKWDYEE